MGVRYIFTPRYGVCSGLALKDCFSVFDLQKIRRLIYMSFSIPPGLSFSTHSMGWSVLADLPSFLQYHDDELTTWVVRISIDLFLSLLFSGGYLSSFQLMVSFRGFSILQCFTFLVC